MLTPFEIYDGYAQHVENLKYLIFGGHFARLATYLEEYLAWFLVPAIFLILLSYILRYFVFEAMLSVFFVSDSHGSARWATFSELKKAGFVRTKDELGKGVILGAVWHWFRRYYIENDIIHTLIIAPTRAGKGIGTILSTVLTYTGSLLVNDPKGELYCMARRERANRGDHVYLVDPFGVVKHYFKKKKTRNMTEEQATSCKFNPMANIFTYKSDCYSRAQDLVEAFCVGSDKDDYFEKQAKNYIITAILYLCECRDKNIECEFPATLPGVRDFLAASTEKLMGHVEKMLESDIFNVRNNGEDMKKVYADGEGQKVWGSIMSSITSFIAMLDDPNLREFFSDHTVDTHMLRYKHSSIFYVSPTTDTKQGIAIARLLFADALLWAQKEHPETENMEQLEQNTLFVMDEFTQLKKFEIVKEGMHIMMGLGITYLIVCQGSYQMEEFYGKGWLTFPGNSLSVYLGAREKDTAKYISETIGQTTIKNKSFSTKGQVSSSEAGRPLVTPDEIINWGPKKPIAMIGEGRPAKLNQIKYFDIWWLNQMADKNPTRR